MVTEVRAWFAMRSTWCPYSAGDATPIHVRVAV